MSALELYQQFGVDAPLFEFPPKTLSETMDSSLYETMNELMVEGILRPPFEECLFYGASMSIGTVDDLDRDDDWEGHPVLIHIKMTEGYKFHLRVTSDVLNQTLGATFEWGRDVVENGHLITMDRIAGTTEEDNKMIFAALNALSHKVSMLMLILGLRYYDHIPQSISRQVRRAAERKGTPIPSHWVTIQLKKSIQDELDAQGGGWNVRPHWRRGHLRRCGPQKNLRFIQPTMVNWKGDAKLLPKNNYEIIGED